MSELLGQLGKLGAYAGAGKAVEDAELLLAQPLVDLPLRGRPLAARRREDGEHVVGSLPGAQVGRAQDDLRPLANRHLGEPFAERFGLPVAERGQRDIDVSLGDNDVGQASALGRVARDVAGTLAMPHDPKRLGPFLGGGGSPGNRHALFRLLRHRDHARQASRPPAGAARRISDARGQQMDACFA